MMEIRQTALNVYETCPHMFKEQFGEMGDGFEYQNDSLPSNKYAMSGIALHETMEHWGQQKIYGINLRERELQVMLDQKMNSIPREMWDNDIDKRYFMESLKEQLSWTYDQVKEYRPIAVEENFSGVELMPGMPPFTGTIDLTIGNLEKHDVDLCDYKTGKVHTRLELKSNMQATIYCLYFLKKYGFLPKHFTFYFSKYKKIKTIEINQEFMERGMERIVSNWMHILNRDFNPPIKPNKWFCQHSCFSVTCRHKEKWGNVGFEVFRPETNLIPTRGEAIENSRGEVPLPQQGLEQREGQ